MLILAFEANSACIVPPKWTFPRNLAHCEPAGLHYYYIYTNATAAATVVALVDPEISNFIQNSLVLRHHLCIWPAIFIADKAFALLLIRKAGI